MELKLAEAIGALDVLRGKGAPGSFNIRGTFDADTVYSYLDVVALAQGGTGSLPIRIVAILRAAETARSTCAHTESKRPMADAGTGEKLKVFISYSRKDSAAFADELVAGLEVAGFAPFLDRHDIAAGEDGSAA